MAATLTFEGPGNETVSVSTGLFINNRFVASVEGETLEIRNAHAGQSIGRISGATAKDVDAAVASSSRAYHEIWKHVTPSKRRQLLLKLSDLIERDLRLFAILEGNDVGALFSTSVNMLGPMAVEWIRYFAGWADKVEGRAATWSSGAENAGLSYTRREPYGVTAAIVPWNTPLLVILSHLRLLS